MKSKSKLLMKLWSCEWYEVVDVTVECMCELDDVFVNELLDVHIEPSEHLSESRDDSVFIFWWMVALCDNTQATPRFFAQRRQNDKVVVSILLNVEDEGKVEELKERQRIRKNPRGFGKKEFGATPQITEKWEISLYVHSMYGLYMFSYYEWIVYVCIHSLFIFIHSMRSFNKILLILFKLLIAKFLREILSPDTWSRYKCPNVARNSTQHVTFSTNT